MKLKRSQEKRITREAQVLRYLRLSKSISTNKAAALVTISSSAIAHIEQGRMGVSIARSRTLVEAYGYTWAEFMEFVDGKTLPINYLDECVRLLAEIDKEKLQTIHQVLLSFGGRTSIQ